MSAAVPLAATLTGAVLSKTHTLGPLLGAGSIGAVYEATRIADGALLAVKVLGEEHLGDDEVRARFLEEGRLCQRLVHPNIVRVFGAAQAEDGSPYMVMERLGGVPLSAYTRAGVRVPLAQAASIVSGVLAGLGAAHAQGIVHRDLKPENVFLARDAAGAFVAKVLDFGIAKVMDAAGGMGSRTRTGALLGTPAYMSPEQVRDSKDTDARSDLWSVGVMLYEMLAGRVAFAAPTEYARLSAVLNASPAPIESIDPQLACMSAFLRRALEKDRQQRFQSALEMARALAAAAGDVPGHTAMGLPLSQLPAVDSMLMPSLESAGAVNVPASDGHGSITPRGARESVPGPHGTLASRPSSLASPEPTPQVSVASGTLPSEHLPMLVPYGARRGVAMWLVVMLVAAALGVGIAIGLMMGRA